MVYRENFKFIGNCIICQVYKKLFLLKFEHIFTDLTKKKEKKKIKYWISIHKQ